MPCMLMQEKLVMQEIPAMTQDSLVRNLARMATIHQRIKALREKRQLSMEQLAERVGVSWQTIQQWENGKTAPKRARLEAVAHALDTTPEYLAVGHCPVSPESNASPAQQSATWPFPSIPEESVRALPEEDRKRLEGALGLAIAQLGIGLAVAEAPRSKRADAARIVAQAAADAANDPDYVAVRRVSVRISAGVVGYSVDNEDDGNGGSIYLPRSWIQRRGLNPERTFATSVRGLSMSPRVHEGDLVIVNPDDTTRRQRQVYAVNHDGEFTLKRVEKKHGRWYLTSDNPDQKTYPPVPCSERTIIIGKVELLQAESI